MREMKVGVLLRVVGLVVVGLCGSQARKVRKVPLMLISGSEGKKNFVSLIDRERSWVREYGADKKQTISLPPIRHIRLRRRLRRRHVAGVGDHDINRPNLVRGRRKSLVQRHFVRDISLVEQNLRVATLLQLRRGFAEDVLAAAGEDDGFGARLVEGDGDVLAEAAAAAGDEDDFACGGVGGVGGGDGWVD